MPRRKIPLKRVCQNCWKEFETYWTNTMFCSVNCKEHKTRNKKCEVCWKEYTTRSRHQKYCSPECKKEGQIKEYEHTCKVRYWVSNISQVKWNREKAKQTIIKRFWEKWLSNEKISKKKQDTCMKKYWVSSPMKVEWIKNKAIETMNKRYWWVWMWSVATREKIKKTNKEKYWVEYQILTESAKRWAHTISSVNLLWLKLLERFNPESEFQLWKYSYDIKIWDTLIDINPFPYHNTTWHPYWKQVDKNYHYERAKNAVNNWYNIINVFDRDDPYKIINNIYTWDKMDLDVDLCSCRKIEYERCNHFIDKWYMQKYDNKDNTIYYWLYSFDDKLILVMWFTQIDNDNRELSIACYNKLINIGDPLKVLFKHFVSLKSPDSIISYCDMSKYDWLIYKTLWFNFVERVEPKCHKYYLHNDKRNNYVDIYDCWQATYVREK